MNCCEDTRMSKRELSFRVPKKPKNAAKMKKGFMYKTNKPRISKVAINAIARAACRIVNVNITIRCNFNVFSPVTKNKALS
jgi:hypothetical protein